MNSVQSGGYSPCYIITDRSNKFVFVANYMGKAIMNPINSDGSLGDSSKADVIEFAKQSSDPSNPNTLIQETIDFLYAMDISSTQKAGLKQSTLLFGQTNDIYWTNAWNDYINNPSDTNKKNTVTNGLYLMLKYLLDLAENQLA